MLKDTLKNKLKNLLYLLKQNPLCIVVAFVYFQLNCTIFNAFLGMPLLLVILVYALSMTVALSKYGELIFRQFNNVRDLYTYKEKEYLMPIFEEVYSEIEKKHPNVSQNIGIYIMDEMTINACAIGRHTIAVTQGAIETLTKEQLKGLIAHEFGHLLHGDTIIDMIIYLGSGIFSLLLLLIKAVIFGIDLLANMLDKSKVTSFAISIFMFIASILMICFTFVIQAGLAFNSRAHEFGADRFAHETGFGSELISAFYLLQKTAMTGKESIANKIKATHPHIARRIGALEKAQGISYEAGISE